MDRLMNCTMGVRAILLALACSTVSWASGPAPKPWAAFGPDGGDARRIVPDPRDHAHLYLGTANGWIYESRTAGASWIRLAQVGQRDDLVLDSIVVDAQNPNHLIVGAWVIDRPDGGLYISWDGGATWTNQAEMRGQSIRALAASPSDPAIMVAGTLRGVYRSSDGGQRWQRISPEDNAEIHNVESIAIDPQDPGIIYAGTWHLPWKTVDGGEHWGSIKHGIIDDSDVFSIIVDPATPTTVFASACSGIYKSENAGLLFKKIQGIPTSARRTRRLLQDPSNLDTVFAGTTEGLFRSVDAGKTWIRTTGPETIVNDVEIDSADPKRVLIATDRGGVLASVDGGDSFHASNRGFSARQVTAIKRDAKRPETIFVGVVNDKDWGGVFQSDNGGQNWIQRSDGLDGRDIFSLGQAPDGTMIAGTAHGLFRLDSLTLGWTRIEAAPGLPERHESVQAILTRPPVPINPDEDVASLDRTPAVDAPKADAPASSTDPAPAAKHAKLTKAQLLAARRHAAALARVHAVAAKPVPHKAVAAKHAPVIVPSNQRVFDGSVYALATAGQTVLATTSVGLLTSVDDGLSWAASGPDGSADWRFIAAAKSKAVAASLHSAQMSVDAGIKWQPVDLPVGFSQISAIAVDPSGEIWIGGREGVFVSSNGGKSWTVPRNLFVGPVSNIFYDDTADRMIITTNGNSSLVFTVQLPSKQVSFADTGWSLRFARMVGDHIVAATLFDGIVVQPRMMVSPITPLPVAQAAVHGASVDAAQAKPQ
jgi:photosystem II stability/assembly factor-like uncharacterized protein